MALQKEINTELNAPFSYWRLGNVLIYHDKKHAQIDIKGYYNREKYLEDKDKFILKHYFIINLPELTQEQEIKDDEGSITGTETIVVQEGKPEYDEWFSFSALEQVGLNPQKQAYLYLKTLPDFEDAIDIDL